MKKKLLMAVSYVLILALGIVGTLAYLTDRDANVNVFTSGDVEIELNEEFEQGAQLLPGKDIEKKVSITNTGDNDAYVWVTIAIPSALDNDDASKNVLHFNYSKESVEEGKWTWMTENSEWNMAEQTIDGEKYNVYTVLHQTALTPNSTTVEAMTKLYLDTHVDYNKNDGKYYWVENGETTLIDYDIANTAVYVVAYAIQAEQFNNVYEAYAAYGKQWGENGGVEYVIEVDNAAGLAAALAKGGNVKLTGNINLDSTVKIAKGTTVNLDLNGKTITGPSFGYGLRNNGGNLTITGNGTIQGDFGALSTFGGKVVIENGTYIANGVAGTTHHCIYIGSGGDLVINGGTFKHNGAGTSDSGAVVTIYDYAGTGASLQINGGTFTGSGTYISAIAKYDSNSTLTITGGTFSKDVTGMVSEGYEVINNGDGTYTVCDLTGKTKIAEGYYSDATGANYYVYSAAGLVNMSTWMNENYNNTMWNKTYNIMTDIDATGVTWVTKRMAPDSSTFNGITFDGNGHAIKNLTIAASNSGSGAGLFTGACNGSQDSTNPSVFKNITFDNVTVNGNSHHTGVVWGEVVGDITLENVYVINSKVSGGCNVGGLIGRNSESHANIKFIDCAVKNTTVEATKKYDNAGASAFLGNALHIGTSCSANVVFEGNNVAEGNTLTTASGMQGGGIYTTAEWDTTTWDTPVVVTTFTNYNSTK